MVSMYLILIWREWHRPQRDHPFVLFLHFCFFSMLIQVMYEIQVLTLVMTWLMLFPVCLLPADALSCNTCSWNYIAFEFCIHSLMTDVHAFVLSFTLACDRGPQLKSSGSEFNDPFLKLVLQQSCPWGNKLVLLGKTVDHPLEFSDSNMHCTINLLFICVR